MALNLLGEIPSAGYNPARVALDPNDPDYLKKLGMVGAIEGHHELNASNTQPDGEAPETAPQMGPSQAQLQTASPSMKPNAKPAPAEMAPPDVQGAAPAMPVSSPAQPAAPNMMQRPAISKLWDKASAAGGVKGVLGKIGTGILGGAEAVGEGLFPGIAVNIPGSFTNTQRNNAINFERQLEAEKEADIEQRTRSEQEYQQTMGRVAGQNADTRAQHELTYGEHQKWTQQHGDEMLAMEKGLNDAKVAFMAGKLDQGWQALDQSMQKIDNQWTEAEQKYGTEQAKVLMQAQLIPIRKQMADAMSASVQQRGAEAGVAAQQKMATLRAQHPWLDMLGMSDIPAAQAGTNAAVPQQAPIPPNTPPPPRGNTGGTAPKVGDIKKFPNGKTGRWDGHGYVLVTGGK